MRGGEEREPCGRARGADRCQAAPQTLAGGAWTCTVRPARMGVLPSLQARVRGTLVEVEDTLAITVRSPGWRRGTSLVWPTTLETSAWENSLKMCRMLIPEVTTREAGVPSGRCRGANRVQSPARPGPLLRGVVRFLSWHFPQHCPCLSC